MGSMPENADLAAREKPGSVGTFARLHSAFSVVDLLKNFLGR